MGYSPQGSKESDTTEQLHSRCTSVCAQSCLTLTPRAVYPTRLLGPWDSQARILRWVAISFSRGSS